MSIYLTPISFTIAIVCFALAIFKFKFLSIAPIALQKVVDRISDGYLVINEDNKVIDFNQTFLNLARLKDTDIRNISIFELIQVTKVSDIDYEKFSKLLRDTKNTTKTLTLNKYFDTLNKYFNIEFSSLNNNHTYIGTLILFKDITQHVEDMQTIQKNQDTLMESERLASLGQLIGRNCTQLKNSYNVYFWSCRRSN